jgi:hypothetical protein
LIPELETRANESLRNLGEKFITTLGEAKVKGTLVRDRATGLPLRVHPTIKDMFLPGENLYYEHRHLSKKVGQCSKKLKNPETAWSATASLSVT